MLKLSESVITTIKLPLFKSTCIQKPQKDKKYEDYNTFIFNINLSTFSYT